MQRTDFAEKAQLLSEVWTADRHRELRTVRWSEMITGILIGLTVLIGSLMMYTSFLIGEMQGHGKGLDEAERIAREVNDELRGHRDRA